ncbi:DUF2924 domain-containing protein [Colwellia sp. C1TZA3]|uniref:DUF2924 domain-containing protein n=1 Tax=Colwellia sp. C1TZA3 TaxID=2508879 RepID=UPI0011B9C7FB|nr:DUF2924 domain-containing protein [Colwellia sp. C1TZA3]
MKKSYKYSPPVKAQKEFLLGNISWHIQAQSIVKNASELRQKIVRSVSKHKASSKFTYKPGTRLIREWHGTSHEVTIEATHFVWQKRKYKNLSEIAREVTGTRWSGPRFFGLTN